jgi:hypothetical protein
MARKRRPSPTEDELRRIAEAIYNLDTYHRIADFESFEDAWNDYLEDSDIVRRKDLKDETFGYYIENNPDVKDTRKQRRKLPQKEAKEYRKMLKKGIMMPSGIPSRGKRLLEYTATIRIEGTTRRKVVFAEKTSVTIKGKKQTVYRDAKGHFVSIKQQR